MAAVDVIAVGIDLLHDFLAQRRRDGSVTLSAQIRSAATAGDKLARRVVASGILNDPSPGKPKSRTRLQPTAAPPAKTRNQLERERISERQHRRFAGEFIAYAPRHELAARRQPA